MATQEDSIKYKYGYRVPDDQWLFFLSVRFFNIFKELVPHEEKIHIIYAGANLDISFLFRSRESIAEEIRDMYGRGKTNFIFDDLDEGVSIPNILLLTQTLDLIEDILPNISIFYASGAHDAEKSYDDICKYHTIDKRLNIISCSSQTYNGRMYLSFTKPYVPGPRSKKFLCFNKVDRQHRIELFEKLLALNLVKDSFYSFDLNQDVRSIIQYSTGYENIRQIIDTLPLRLNITENRSNPVDIIDDDLKYFDQSYFSVVTETLFYEIILKECTDKKYYNTLEVAAGIFPTEKIYKCIALNHPFIVLSTKGYLQELRNVGYKTFHPYIDESYDNIEDDDLRLDAVVKEINRLCKLSENELINFTHNVKDIVEHNSNFFHNLSDARITKNVLGLLK